MSYFLNYLPTVINCEETKTLNYILYKKQGNSVYAAYFKPCHRYSSSCRKISWQMLYLLQTIISYK